MAQVCDQASSPRLNLPGRNAVDTVSGARGAKAATCGWSRFRCRSRARSCTCCRARDVLH
jgi:hypothetical protein